MRKLMLSMFLAATVLAAPFSIASSDTGSASKGTSPLDRFNAEEIALLKAGEPVYRHVEEKKEDGNVSGTAYSHVIVNQPAKKCYDIFNEYDKHEEYFPRKKKSDAVKTEGNRTWVYKEFSFYVTTIEYTVIYTAHPEELKVNYDLDLDSPHDIDDTAGYFMFEPIDENTCLFTYAVTKLDTGVSVPGFIREYITSKDLPNVAIHVKKRMESGGTWKKEE